MIAFNRCFHPLKTQGGTCSSSLRKVTQAVATKFNIDPRAKICNSCRIKLRSLGDLEDGIDKQQIDEVFESTDEAVISPVVRSDSDMSIITSQMSSDTCESISQERLFQVNAKLSVLGQSPMNPRKLQ